MSYKTVDPLSGVIAVKEDVLKDGFVVVIEQDIFKGILTAADILKSPHNLVLDCLQEKPRIDYEKNIESILDQMKNNGFDVLPVFKQDIFIGIIHQNDIMEFLTEYKKEIENKLQVRTLELEQINAQLVREIAEKEKAEKEKQALMEQMYHSDKVMAIGTLAGGIAHDFNNLLSPIIGFSESALKDTKEGSSLWNDLNEIFTAGKRAKDLVSQILKYAHNTETSNESIEMGPILDEGLKLIRSTFPSSIEIRQHIETDAMVKADPTMIHQIYMNLCTNSYHAMDETGGILEVGLKKIEFRYNSPDIPKGIEPGDYIRMTVSDNGTGIVPEYINNIFDPYFTTKKVGKGTGMGLSVVYGILKSYGGAITVHSKLGKGSTFNVYIPISQQMTKKKAVENPPMIGGNEKILFVDDDPAIARLNEKILGKLGYKIKSMTDPIQAIELFKSMPDDFDLVITDMTMPGMNGDMLTCELLKIRSNIPVILCTGYNRSFSEERASEIGFRAFAYKPVLCSELAKIIRHVLDNTIS